MLIALAAICDAANVSSSGKLNILGQFDTIFAGSFPATHAAMALVVRMLTEAEDAKKGFDLDISLIDEDSAKLWGAAGQFQLGEVAAGTFGHANQIIELRGVTFPKAGRYRFRLFLSGREEPTDVVFQLVQLEKVL